MVVSLLRPLIGALFTWDTFSVCGGMGQICHRKGEGGQAWRVWGEGMGGGRRGVCKECPGLIWRTPKEPGADLAWGHF